jgi:RND family efflux transporter MFP subunit
MKRACLLLALLTTASCQRRGEGASVPHVPVVRTTQVRLESDHALERRGEVAAAARLHLGFHTPGTVRAVYAREGDAVQKGQLLALLDDTSAAASLRDDEASLDLARSESEATRSLVQSGSIAPRAYERASTDLQRAMARQDLARKSLTDTRLYAPIAGRVLARRIEPGEVVDPGREAFVLDDSRGLSIRLGLTPRDVSRVRVHQDVALVRLRADSAAELPGHVYSVAPAPNPEDALYTVEIRPKDQPWTDLRPGEQVSVRFVESEPPAVLRVPLEAIVHRRDQDLVFAAVDEAGGTRAHPRAVRVRGAEGADVVVESGVKPGDRIVSEGAYFLEDGDVVTVAGGDGR